jgi:hypothetical protein
MEKGANDLNALEAAIYIKHNCRPVHKSTAFVRAQTRDQQTLWEGYVEIFELMGHPDATTCYAWQYVDSNGRAKVLALLGNNIITSAQKAVQAAIFIDAQPPARTYLNDLKDIKKQLEECKNLIRKMGIQSEELSASVDSAREIKGDIARRRDRQ